MRRKLASTFVLALILVGSIWLARGVSRASAETRFVIIPGRIWLKDNVRLSDALGLNRDSIYVYERGTWRNLAWIPGRYPDYVVVATQGDLIAVVGARRPRPSEGKMGIPMVSIVDFGGTLIGDLDSAMEPSWSPDGRRLAFVFGREVEEAPSIPDSMGIWDSRMHESQHFQSRPHQVSWLDDSTLVLDYWSRRTEFNLGDGTEKPSRHQGIDVSPDRDFSISNRAESEVQIWDDRNGREITREVRALMAGSQFVDHPIPFWLNTPGAGHVLCMPACVYPPRTNKAGSRAPSGRAQCATLFVDVDRLQVLKRISEEVIAVSPDRTAVAIRDQRAVRPLVLDLR